MVAHGHQNHALRIGGRIVTNRGWCLMTRPKASGREGRDQQHGDGRSHRPARRRNQPSPKSSGSGRQAIAQPQPRFLFEERGWLWNFCRLDMLQEPLHALELLAAFGTIAQMLLDASFGAVVFGVAVIMQNDLFFGKVVHLIELPGRCPKSLADSAG